MICLNIEDLEDFRHPGFPSATCQVQMYPGLNINSSPYTINNLETLMSQYVHY